MDIHICRKLLARDTRILYHTFCRFSRYKTTRNVQKSALKTLDFLFFMPYNVLVLKKYTEAKYMEIKYMGATAK